MRRKMGLTFPLLVDPDLAVIRRYGILNREQGNVPHPTALVLDEEGVIRYRRIDVDYRRRPPSDELLAAIRRIGAAPDGDTGGR